MKWQIQNEADYPKWLAKFNDISDLENNFCAIQKFYDRLSSYDFTKFLLENRIYTSEDYCFFDSRKDKDGLKMLNAPLWCYLYPIRLPYNPNKLVDALPEIYDSLPDLFFLNICVLDYVPSEILDKTKWGWLQQDFTILHENKENFLASLRKSHRDRTKSSLKILDGLVRNVLDDTPLTLAEQDWVLQNLDLRTLNNTDEPEIKWLTWSTYIWTEIQREFGQKVYYNRCYIDDKLYAIQIFSVTSNFPNRVVYKFMVKDESQSSVNSIGRYLLFNAALVFYNLGYTILDLVSNITFDKKLYDVYKKAISNTTMLRPALFSVREFSSFKPTPPYYNHTDGWK